MLGVALASAGRLEESRAALLELLGVVPAEDVMLRVRLTAECAGVEHLLGLHQQARDRLVAALEHVPHRASPEAVALMLELAMDGFYRMDYEQMRDVGANALEGARRLDERSLTAAADSILASGAAMAGRIGEARSRAAAAASAMDAMPDSELAGRLETAAQLGWTEFYIERYEDSIAHLERGIAISRATGQGQRLPAMTEALACSMFMRGRLADAAELQEHALEAARLSTNPQRLCWALFNRAWTARLAGDLDLALRAGQESAALARELDDSIVSALAQAVLAVALLDTEDDVRGIEQLLTAAGGPELPLIPRPRKCVYYDPLVQAELRRGRPQAAARFAELAEAAAEGLGLRVPTSLAQRGRAAVMLEAGEPAGAGQLALASAAGAHQAGARLEAARSRTLAGRALAAAGERDSATAELGTAVQELEECRAVRYREEAVRELRRLGVRVARRSSPGGGGGGGIASLSARERELADLVWDRKTNAQIAAELFLSQKTVESHLRNIFHKLGVSSRVDVARAVERARG
jgi:DNA-binding CsgD family transcriptional regulator